MRAFTMARERMIGAKKGGMVMFFGARTQDSLPYFGPLNKLSDDLLEKHLSSAVCLTKTKNMFRTECLKRKRCCCRNAQ